MSDIVKLEGNYTSALKTYFDDIYRNMKGGVPDTDYAIKRTSAISYEMLKEMFPDLEDIPKGQWSEYSICLEKDNEEALNIGIYKEDDDYLKELQRDYPERDIKTAYSIEYFVGGDLANNVGGEMTDCITIMVSRDKKTYF